MPCEHQGNRLLPKAFLHAWTGCGARGIEERRCARGLDVVELHDEVGIFLPKHLRHERAKEHHERNPTLQCLSPFSHVLPGSSSRVDRVLEGERGPGAWVGRRNRDRPDSHQAQIPGFLESPAAGRSCTRAQAGRAEFGSPEEREGLHARVAPLEVELLGEHPELGLGHGLASDEQARRRAQEVLAGFATGQERPLDPCGRPLQPALDARIRLAV